MAEYQRLYTLLFGYIFSGRGDGPEANDLRRQMEELPGRGSDKSAWGQDVGRPLYEKAIGDGGR